MAEQIRIKAAKDAPEFVAHGNLEAEKKNGHFVTENRRFADHLIASGFGTEETTSAEAEAAAKKKGGNE